MKTTNTKSAFRCLLAIPVYTAVSALMFALAMIFSNSDIHLLYALPSIIFGLLFAFAPLIFLILSICGLVNQILALRSHESKAKNIAMMIVTILLIVGSLQYAYIVWLMMHA